MSKKEPDEIIYEEKPVPKRKHWLTVLKACPIGQSFFISYAQWGTSIQTNIHTSAKMGGMTVVTEKEPGGVRIWRMQ